MTRGIRVLDNHLGGVQKGRLHLLTGGPGAGKTAACLHFLNAGLLADEPGLLITTDRITDLASHARCNDLQLAGFVRAGRLLIARFRMPYCNRAGSAAEELDAFIKEVRPGRIAIDPVTPLLCDRLTLALVAHTLDSCGATSIVTYHDDVTRGYDARLAAVVQSAATIIHLARAARPRLVQVRT